jgi:hypothetical protein
MQDGLNRTRKLLAFLTAIFDALQTPEQLAQGLDNLNVTPEIETLMIQLAGSGPLLLRWIITKFGEGAEKRLPKLPSGRQGVTAKTQLEILRYVDYLHYRQGTTKNVATMRAAQKFGCSVRTVQRYWDDRKRILKEGPKYHFNDLMNELVASLKADIAADLASQSGSAAKDSLAAVLDGALSAIL